MTHIFKEEVLSRGIMVDVETAGPTPFHYPLLSIGASVISNPNIRFYRELKPDILNYDLKALAVCKLNPDVLLKIGVKADRAIDDFMCWVKEQKENPLFVAHDAAFGWMFIAVYLDKYCFKNHFGHCPFDTKSAYGSIMHSPIPHHAGKDAFIQTHDLLHFYSENTAS